MEYETVNLLKEIKKLKNIEIYEFRLHYPPQQFSRVAVWKKSE